MYEFRRILVPVDFSSEARMAVEWALFVLKRTPKAELFLLHVAPFHAYADTLVWKDDALDRRWDTEKRELERWQENLTTSIRSDFILGTGSVAVAVRRACERHQIDLVIMVTRAHRRFPPLVRPSKTERVVRIAPCPVLVLHISDRKRTGRRRLAAKEKVHA